MNLVRALKYPNNKQAVTELQIRGSITLLKITACYNALLNGIIFAGLMLRGVCHSRLLVLYLGLDLDILKSLALLAKSLRMI